MLTKAQRDVLEALIHRELGVNPNTDIVARFVGDDLALQMPTATIVSQIAKWIVGQSLRHSQPDLLIHIIQEVDDGSIRTASLIDVSMRLDDDPSLWKPMIAIGNVDWDIDKDPTEMGDGRPFIDRLAFRNLLPRVPPCTTPVCTVVLGDAGSGKTYLQEYCMHFAARSGDRRVGFTRAGTSKVNGLDPELLALELARELETEIDKMPRPHEDPHRHAQNLVAWIIQYTPKRSMPNLVIFDGFDHKDVPPAVHTFIEELVLAIQRNTEAQEHFRVVLLGYTVLRLEERSIRFDSYVLEHVGPDEIKAWFRKRFPGHPDYRYEDTTKMIDQKLPSGAQRMRRLCSLVQLSQRKFQ